MADAASLHTPRDRRFPVHGWAGLALVLVFWTLNWSLSGLRTQWAFFPLWLGYLGYLVFAWEVFALYHLLVGRRRGEAEFVQV